MMPGNSRGNQTAVKMQSGNMTPLINNSSSILGNNLKGASPLSMNDQIHEGFGNYMNKKKGILYKGSCYLKTKTDRFKEHWAVLNGNEVFCYRDQVDTKSRVMHCLAGTFVKDIPVE